MKLKRIILLFFSLFIALSIFSYANAISINSEAAILVEASTGRIIYEKNSTKQMYPASTTKIMTGILAIENCNLDDMVTVSETAESSIPEGYVTKLVVGEEISVRDLLYLLMLPSANDAACVLAEHISGSVDEFSDLMNRKARELGCQHTHFVNPNGIHSEYHYSTAYDLYLIANYAMKNQTFRDLVNNYTYTISETNKHNQVVLQNTNELLNSNSRYYYKYAIGIKTGYTSVAGNCLVSEASRDGLEFISVTLKGGNTQDGSNARFADTKELFNYAYDNYTLTKVIEKGHIVNSIEVKNATKETKNLDLLINDTITVINNVNIDTSTIIPEIVLNDNILAPISSGDVLGTIKYKIDDIEYSSTLIAANDVIEKTDYTFVLIIIGVILLIFAVKLYSAPKKKRKKYKQRLKNMY